MKQNEEVQLDLQHFEIFIFLSLLPSLLLGKWERKSCFIHGTPNCFIDLFHFLHVVNYKSVKWEPVSMDHRPIMKAEFKNPWNISTMMIRKQACLCCNFLFLFIILFLLKWDFLQTHFVKQSIMINVVLSIQSPKMSDWCFVWQNGYKFCPNESIKKN